MKLSKYLLYSACCYMAVISVSTASIVSTSGSVMYTAAPASVDIGGSEDSASIIAFDEQQGVILSSDLSVDYLASTSVAGTLAAGDQLNSYFIHFDPVGTSEQMDDLITLSGSITFSNQITGLIFSGVSCAACPATPEYIDASDFLGAAGTYYPIGVEGRGLELDSDPYYTGRGDFFTISADGYTLDLSLTAYPLYLDQVRVVTSVVPVPAAAYLFISGLISLSFMGRKKRQL